ncbi:TrkA family potassium uptake protein [Maritimibacter sp. DP1N21-5]|uniref:potassium channel family protein n=1 Tax=Maritimibacter sp. DP1N21-5 TaxID=2836867 RepID=UPI001C4799B4|nr:TrkA family potassium uptake protein [Maritimibacter sp. DP1N21-5]MBV7408695.1 TrkA family potassium uptake protein [Maritimibacter sp. DP1N21-5]
MAREERSFAVIGLGAFGGTVALELARFGNHVIGIDADEGHVSRASGVLPATVILDARDELALREAGIDRYDVALVAIGTDLEASILATMNLKMLGVGTIWVKANNKTHHRILSKIGADRVILPEQEMGRHTAQMLNNPAVTDYMSLGNGFSVVNVVIPARLEGRELHTLGIGATHDLRLLGMMRGTEHLSPDTPNLTLEKGDKLLLLGRRPDLQYFGDRL